MAMADPTDLCGRVNALIDRFFGGNRTKAAKAWAVPQPTVQRLAVGTTETVRATTLARIAEMHDTTIDWLMSGRGPNPLSNDPVPYVEYRDFRDLVDSLELSLATRQAVLDLPKAISTAHTILCQWGMTSPEPPAPQPEGVMQTSRDAKYQASALHHMSWAYLFDGLIKAYGRERVREKLESEFRRIRLGFHPRPMNLFWVPEGRAGLDALDTWLDRPGVHPAGLALIEYPALPPLDAISPSQAKPKRGRPVKLGPAKP
jgi:hypothetical protein